MGLIDLVAGHPVPTPHAEALKGAEHGVAVYWRPGCVFCNRLRMAVAGSVEVDVAIEQAESAWSDAIPRIFVRTVA